MKYYGVIFIFFEKVLKCFANWIALKGNDEILFEFPKLNITNLAFMALNSPELMEKGVKCLCNFIKRISSNESYLPLFEFAFEKVLALFPQYINYRIRNEKVLFVDLKCL